MGDGVSEMLGLVDHGHPGAEPGGGQPNPDEPGPSEAGNPDYHGGPGDYPGGIPAE